MTCWRSVFVSNKADGHEPMPVGDHRCRKEGGGNVISCPDTRSYMAGATAQELDTVFSQMNKHAPRQILAELYRNDYEPYISNGRLFLAKEPIRRGGKSGSEDRHIWQTDDLHKQPGQQLWNELQRSQPPEDAAES
jgi:hypothetical protein